MMDAYQKVELTFYAELRDVFLRRCIRRKILNNLNKPVILGVLRDKRWDLKNTHITKSYNIKKGA